MVRFGRRGKDRTGDAGLVLAGTESPVAEWLDRVGNGKAGTECNDTEGIVAESDGSKR